MNKGVYLISLQRTLIKENFKVNYLSSDSGWINFEVVHEDKKWQINASHFHDPFSNLISWQEQIIDGKDSSSFSINEEGSEVILSHIRINDKICYFKIECKDIFDRIHFLMNLEVDTYTLIKEQIEMQSVKDPENIKKINDLKEKINDMGSSVDMLNATIQKYAELYSKDLESMLGRTPKPSDAEVKKLKNTWEKMMKEKVTELTRVTKDLEAAKPQLEKTIFLSKALESGLLASTKRTTLRETDLSAVYEVFNSNNDGMVGAAANHLNKIGVAMIGSNVNLNTVRLVNKELPTQDPRLAPGEGFVRTDNILGVALATPGDPNSGVTSELGWRNDPTTGKPLAWHSGVDVASPLGTPIGFPTDGKVVSVKPNDERSLFQPGHGNQVVVQIQNSDYAYSVSHNSAILVKEGQTIKAGQAISLSGNSGRTIGNNGGYHTHVEIYKRDSKGDWNSIKPTPDDLKALQGIVGAGR